MKQKLINNILYVFSVEPYEITEDVENADVIKVQRETLDGYIELNPDLIDKLTPYNYHVMTVNKLEWADYVDEPDPVTKYNIILHGGDLQLANTTYVCGYVNGEVTWLPYDYNYDYNQITIQYEAGLPFQIDERLASVGSYTPENIVSSEDTLWDIGSAFIMPESDVEFTLNAIQEEPEPVSGNTITLTGTGLNDETITIKVGGETVPVQETYESVLSDEFFEIFPLKDIANYTLASENMQFENDPTNYHWFIAPQEDMTIELNYTEQV